MQPASGLPMRRKSTMGGGLSRPTIVFRHPGNQLPSVIVGIACAVSASIPILVPLAEGTLVRCLTSVGGVVALRSILVGATERWAIAVAVIVVCFSVCQAGLEAIVVSSALGGASAVRTISVRSIAPAVVTVLAISLAVVAILPLVAAIPSIPLVIAGFIGAAIRVIVGMHTVMVRAIAGSIFLSVIPALLVVWVVGVMVVPVPVLSAAVLKPLLRLRGDGHRRSQHRDCEYQWQRPYGVT